MPSMVKSYYWSVLAEAAFCGKGDFLRAVECCTKSIEAEHEYHDGRIVLARILLQGARHFLQGIENIDPRGDAVGVFQFSTQTASAAAAAVAAAAVASGEDKPVPATPPLVAFEVLSEAFKKKDICESETNVLLTILSVAPPDVRSLLLTTLSVLSVPDQVILCTQVLGVWRCVPAKRPSSEVLCATWILATARLLLSGVRLDAILSKFEAQLVTQYRLWMHVDALAARCLLNELLGDHAKARNDCAFLARSIASVRSSMPPCCAATGVNAGSRLVSLENASEMMQAALGSFERIASDSAAAPSALPAAVLAGHQVQSALLLLIRARRSAPRGLGDLGTAGAADVTKALTLLTNVREHLATAEDERALLDMHLITPHPRSLTLLLPATPSDPRNVAALTSGRTVCLLLAAITASREPPESASLRVAQVLEWGANRETSPTADVAWYLAKALLDARTGRLDDAISLLSQSHAMALDEARDGLAKRTTQSWQDVEAGKRAADTASLLAWMRFYPQVSAQPWLPSTLLVDLLLQKDVRKALKECRQAMVDLFDPSSQLLTALGSCAAMQTPHPDAWFNPDAPGYDVRARCGMDAASSLQDGGAGRLHAEGRPGLAGALYRLGLCHAAMGRKAGLVDAEKRVHLKVALGCFGLLPWAAVQGEGSRVEEEEVVLQRAVLLAELGDSTAAVALVRSALGAEGAATTPASFPPLPPPQSQSPPPPTSSLLHLLSLLLSSSTGVEDPTALSASAVFCQRALSLTAPATLPHANVKTTLAVLDWAAGDADSALSAATQVLHFFRTTERQRREADEDARRRAGEAELARRQSEGQSEGEGESKTSVLVDSCGCLWLGAPPTPKAHNDYLVKAYGVGQTRITLPYKRRAADILLQASRLLRSARDYQCSFDCLAEAWALLFMPSDCASADMLDDPSILEHRRRELLRTMPTLLGWRLPECAGWGAQTLPESEAAVLLEAGLLVLARSPEATADAEELFRMALAIDPSCGPALLAVAELELAALPSASGSDSANSEPGSWTAAAPTGKASLPSAVSAATQALSLMEFSPQAWCTFGKTLEAAGQASRAAEAYLAAVEMARLFAPLRPLDCVL